MVSEKSKLKALSDIASIDITLEFNSILQNILKITCETMNSHSGTMMLVDENNKLRMAVSYGLAPDYHERVHETAKKAGVPLAFSPSGAVLETGKCYLVPNVFKEPRCTPWDDLSKEFGFSSQIFTPMKRGLKVIGLLNVYMANPHDFTEEDINFVTTAASQASSVVQNARMCCTLKNNIQELNVYKESLEKKIKEAYKKLYDSEEKYRDIFENANDCLYIHDAEGNFREVNNTALKLLGCTREEIIGTHMSEWITPESLNIARNCLENGLAGGEAEQQMLLEVICKNGEHRWMEIRRRLVKEGDRITAVHGMGRDITEKRKMEQQLKESNEKLEKSYEELKEADKLKSDFISNITHELFTPLTSIKGFTELIHSGDLGAINEEQKNGLETILRGSDRLSGLIKELLDAANLEKNQLELRFEFTSINDITSKSVMELQPQMKDKKITIFQEIPTLPRIWGDSERLTQVMINVLSNAIKFTPENGKITITAEENTDRVKISITDTGIGIPQDKLLHIFDRFYQVDGSTSRRYGGMGLGLSICKSIVEKHDGSIWAESEGKGSTFHIVLPKLTANIGEPHVASN
ncbi:MAG: ATP-binding protein [Candidatus Methanoperedens sp.]